MKDYSDLKCAAQAAMQASLKEFHHADAWYTENPLHEGWAFIEKEDAKFMEMASPKVILELLEMLDRRHIGR